MTLVHPTHLPTAGPGPGRWHTLAERVLEGQPLGREQGLEILRSDDEELLDLLAAAYRVRRRWFGNRVHLNFLVNASCGACGEDCGYCSQSKVSKADITPLQPRRCRRDCWPGRGWPPRRQAKTYCIVISGRAPTDGTSTRLLEAVPAIKAEYGLKICFSLGLLTPGTSPAAEGRRRRPRQPQPQHQPAILSADLHHPLLPGPARHTPRRPPVPGWKSAPAGSSAWARKTPTWSNWRCDSAALRVEAVPVNFLAADPGHSSAKRAHRSTLNPALLPEGAGAVSAGQSPRASCGLPPAARCTSARLQPLGLYPANSIFVGDYLTTGPAAGRRLSHDRSGDRRGDFEVGTELVGTAMNSRPFAFRWAGDAT